MKKGGICHLKYLTSSRGLWELKPLPSKPPLYWSFSAKCSNIKKKTNQHPLDYLFFTVNVSPTLHFLSVKINISSSWLILISYLPSPVDFTSVIISGVLTRVQDDKNTAKIINAFFMVFVIAFPLKFPDALSMCECLLA